jgi:hypothetical protein
MIYEYLVYGLFDPRNGELRYIGKSSSGIDRALRHANKSVLDKERTHKANWIRTLHALGLKYEAVALEHHSNHTELIEAEAFWIEYYRSIGCRLTNTRDGGGGGPPRGRAPEEPKPPKPPKEWSPRRPCPDCGKRKHTLDSNKSCKKCNRMRGLKQCPRCNVLLPIDLGFYADQSACAVCKKKARDLRSAEKD